jgi:hypothetical protein
MSVGIMIGERGGDRHALNRVSCQLVVPQRISMEFCNVQVRIIVGKWLRSTSSSCEYPFVWFGFWGIGSGFVMISSYTNAFLVGNVDDQKRKYLKRSE